MLEKFFVFNFTMHAELVLYGNFKFKSMLIMAFNYPA